MHQRILSTLLYVFCLKCLLISGCNTGTQKDPEITVFAAMSLTNALTDIGKEYAKKHKVHVSFNFAASTTLQRQIEKGASADVFISASTIQADALEKLGLLEANSREDLLTNRLVIVAHKESDISIRDPIDVQQNAVSRIAIGQPEIVPAGFYAKEVLKHYNLWDKIQPKLIFSTDVRATLAYVSTGNVDIAIVYQTDTTVSDQVKIVYRFPPNTHSTIVYPVVILKGSKQKLISEAYIEFLKTPIAYTIFNKHGFTHLSSDTLHQNSLNELK